MNRAEFDSAVDRAIEGLPDWVVDAMDNIHVVVEDRPNAEQGDVLGIYEGVSLLERSSDYWGALPDRIIVFREPHLELGLEGDELEADPRTGLGLRLRRRAVVSVVSPPCAGHRPGPRIPSRLHS
jgi:predicted Zn-dependent protease with MMP-like domain